MLSLEQIKLLESKIVRAIDFVNQITEENARLKKRNGELEEALSKLRDEKTRVEEGFNSAMGRLTQFEDVIDRSLSAIKSGVKQVQTNQQAQPAASPQQPVAASPPQPAAAVQPARQSAPPPAAQAAPPQTSLPSAYTVDEEEPEDESDESGEPEEYEGESSDEAELDIF